MVKRNILSNDAIKWQGEQAYTNKEFLISKDEGFRPVNNFNGPDGSLYVVDMHRGIIQHKTYLTGYLRQQYLDKGLDSIVGMGRILRLGKALNPLPKLNIGSWQDQQLIDSLASKNIWMRNRAQQHLVYRGTENTVKLLLKTAEKSNHPKQLLHCYYALDGLNSFKDHFINNKNLGAYPKLAAITLKLAVDNKITLTENQYNRLASLDNRMVDYYLGYYLAKNTGNHLDSRWLALVKKYNDSTWFTEPLLVHSFNKEAAFLKSEYTTVVPNTLHWLDSLKKIQLKKRGEFTANQDHLTRGRTLFNRHCATCHGPDGAGIENLAPPLLQSNYLTEPKERFLAVMLYGLSGPVTVNGKTYDYGISMPGIGGSTELTDQNIKDIGNYMRNAFTNEPKQDVDLKTITKLRNLDRPLDQTFTETELHDTFKND